MEFMDVFATFSLTPALSPREREVTYKSSV